MDKLFVCNIFSLLWFESDSEDQAEKLLFSDTLVEHDGVHIAAYGVFQCPFTAVFIYLAIFGVSSTFLMSASSCFVVSVNKSFVSNQMNYFNFTKGFVIS